MASEAGLFILKKNIKFAGDSKWAYPDAEE